MASDREKEQFSAAVDANKVKEAEKAAGSGCALFFMLAFATWIFLDRSWYNYLFWGAVVCGLISVANLWRVYRLKKKYEK